MKKLFSRMQEFQYEKIKNNPDTVLTDEIRVLQDEDIQRYTSSVGYTDRREVIILPSVVLTLTTASCWSTVSFAD